MSLYRARRMSRGRGAVASPLIRLTVGLLAGMIMSHTLSPHAAAQSCATSWVLKSEFGPDARYGHAMAYDSARDRVVLFGGASSSGDTWEWDEVVWHLAATMGPGARSGHAMAFDSARGQTLLFGGFASAVLGDTWVWDGMAWAQRAATGPVARSNAALAYDSARGKVVLFGGLDAGFNKLGDTWEWDGTGWILVAAGGPSARDAHAMAYDAARGCVLLFGGVDAGSVYQSDTWEWDGSAWVLSDSFGPSARAYAAMAYEDTCSRMVLFGGLAADGNLLNDTWERVGGLWALRDSSGPGGRFSHAIASGGEDDRIMLFGGLSGPVVAGDTWARDESPSTPEQNLLDDVIAPPGGLRAAYCGTPLYCTSSVFGQIPPYIPTLQTPQRTVAMNFNVFLKTDGSGNWRNCASDIADLTLLANWMNNYLGMYLCTPSDPCPGFTYLTDTKVRVSLANIYFYHAGDALWSSCDYNAQLNLIFQIHPTARDQLNVLWTGCSSGASGLALLPDANHHYDQCIIMPNSTTSNCDGLKLNYGMASTLTHELGHVLSLLHMYAGCCSPEPTCDPSNCEYLYDVFCPPTNPCYQDAGWSCNPWLPPTSNSCTNNMMGGTAGACLFSPMQIGKIHRALAITSANRYVQPSGCVPPPPNLVLWLPFDEAFGPTARNAPGPNPGTHVNSPTVITGKVSNALCFNGTSQWVDVPNYAGISFGGTNLTLDAWVRRPLGNGLDGVGVLVDKRYEQGAILRGYSFYLSDGVLGFQLADSTGFTNYNAGTVGGAGWVPDDGNWHHVAVTVNRNSASGGQFYRDGLPVGPPFNPTLRGGPIGSTAPFRVGARTAAPAGTGVFSGCLDEVEAFARALDPGEVQAIYNAQAAGKCKRYCQVPWDSPFCLNDTSINLNAQVCNATTLPQTFMYWFEGLPVDTGCSIDGPTTFTPCSGLITVPPGTCSSVPVTIDRPAGMTAANLVGCYRMTIQSLGNNNPDKFECRGSVQDRRDWCVFFPNDTYTALWRVPLNIGPITITNTTATAAALTYEFVVLADDMTPDTTVVSLNGAPPGTSALGSLFLGAGESTTLNLTIEFVEYQPLRFFTLLMQADTEGLGVMDPLASTRLSNIVTCWADLDEDGDVDKVDYSAFSSCLVGPGGIPAAGCGCVDLDGDGDADLRDFAVFQAAFTGG